MFLLTLRVMVHNDVRLRTDLISVYLRSGGEKHTYLSLAL